MSDSVGGGTVEFVGVEYVESVGGGTGTFESVGGGTGTLDSVAGGIVEFVVVVGATPPSGQI
jgi:hypothetical protein